jgi:hypothetical protein
MIERNKMQQTTKKNIGTQEERNKKTGNLSEGRRERKKRSEMKRKTSLNHLSLTRQHCRDCSYFRAEVMT